MGLANNIGRYQLARTIGEGSFAKVKLGVDSRDSRQVAVKIIDKNLVVESNLKCQVKREITTMKLLHHPNIVRIHEVIGTKSKIYIVMEYVSGGQLSDKLSYAGKLSEDESRKMFQQLIDAVDYCHSRGVYHRDLKPDNLLLDNKGNLKVSDFGLSALQKPGSLLSTACGSPCYVAPELLASKDYDGAASDVWACGVILFELMAGHLPFDDRNLMNLYRKISRAEYTCPEWFTEAQRRLISRILDPNPKTRIKINEITEDPWFQRNYLPACGFEHNEKKSINDVSEAFDALEVKDVEKLMPESSHFINAFQLIATSNDLDLSGLFEEQDENKQKMKLGSKNTVDDTLKKIEAAALDLSLSVEISNNKIKMHPLKRATSARCPRSHFNLSAEVTEVAPTHCVVEVSRSAGELGVYKQFCKSLTYFLTGKSSIPPTENFDKISQDIQDTECSEEEMSESGSFQSYSSP